MPTRSQREADLYSEANWHGISAEHVDAAIALLRHEIHVERAVCAKVHGTPLTADQWKAEHPALFEVRAFEAGRRIKSLHLGRLLIDHADALDLTPLDDERPAECTAVPLGLSDITSPAYHLETNGPNGYAHSDQSGAFVRAAVVVALRHGGAASIEPLTQVVAISDGAVPHIRLAHPKPHITRPTCARCGQWATEHQQAGNHTACNAFETKSGSRLGT
ncbi:hypothetical protein [Streptomyces luteireticuli]|uniref:hypothetical protein n=1 Tax=Streptomyces luteireticuli TaxID=173858 RepID=UPI0035577F54